MQWYNYELFYQLTILINNRKNNKILPVVTDSLTVVVRLGAPLPTKKIIIIITIIIIIKSYRW